MRLLDPSLLSGSIDDIRIWVLQAKHMGVAKGAGGRFCG